MNIPPPKHPVHWVGYSLEDLRAMPEDVKDSIGQALLSVQYGNRPHNATALQGFTGASVLEIKDNYDGDTYRCVYTVRFAEAVYVLHAFQKSKRGRKTTSQDNETVKRRLKWAEEDYKATYGVQIEETNRDERTNN